MDTITARIDQGQGTLGKLSTDSTLFDNLKRKLPILKGVPGGFPQEPQEILEHQVAHFLNRMIG